MDELNQVFLETHPQTRTAEIKSGNFFVKKHDTILPKWIIDMNASSGRGVSYIIV